MNFKILIWVLILSIGCDFGEDVKKNGGPYVEVYVDGRNFDLPLISPFIFFYHLPNRDSVFKLGLFAADGDYIVEGNQERLHPNRWLGVPNILFDFSPNRAIPITQYLDLDYLKVTEEMIRFQDENRRVIYLMNLDHSESTITIYHFDYQNDLIWHVTDSEDDEFIPRSHPWINSDLRQIYLPGDVIRAKINCKASKFDLETSRKIKDNIDLKIVFNL